jgi:hypothetical protein
MTSTFLYALWRDFVWDRAFVDVITVCTFAFLYALWRDFVWDEILALGRYAGGFLYALWRDFVWDGPGQGAGNEILLQFLYALWRDFVWDAIDLDTTAQDFMFLYALWRDFVWDGALRWSTGRCAFLYALWRDFVWDEGVRSCRDGHDLVFLYALWRDFVWDPASVCGLVTSGDEGRLHTSPAGGRARPPGTCPGGCLCWLEACTGDGLSP